MIGENTGGIFISSDSKYVGFACGSGNCDPDGTRPSGYATYIFRLTDLKKPLIVLKSGAYPCAVGFDAVTRHLYSQNFDANLISFRSDGEPDRRIDFGRPNEITTNFYVHILMATGHS